MMAKTDENTVQGSKMNLEPHELARYNRHLKLAGFGRDAQLKLKSARVLLIGAGGLGCPIGLYLAAAGVGTIGVVDDDLIEISNLQRQIAHATENQGQPKVESLINAMRSLNPLPDYQAYPHRLDAANVTARIADYDLIIDGTDNYPTRYLVADACYFAGKPLVYGAIHGFEAQLSLFDAGGPCYRCLFPYPPEAGQTPSCNEAGVLGVLPGAVGIMMATEAIKYLTGVGQSLKGRLALYSALDMSIRHIGLSRDGACPLCGERPVITSVRQEQIHCEVLPEVPRISVTAASELYREGTRFLDVREPDELEICRMAKACFIPLAQLDEASLAGYDRTLPLVVFCHKGVRSRRGVARLLELGFENVFSLDGGIDAWAQEIDSEMVRY